MDAVYTGMSYTKCGNFSDDPTPPRFLPSSSSSSSSAITKKLLTEGKVIKSVLPDGNCFFRSIAVYLHGDEEYHMSVRKELCAHMTMNQTNYSSLLFHNSIASHLKQMAKPGTWATQVELQAAANYYCTDLYVLTEKPNKTEYHWIHYKASTTSPNDKENYCKRTFSHIQLAHSSSVHFDAVVDIRTKKVPKAPPLLEGKMYEHNEVL